jgi:potassium-dependent mechanosensitive channel
LAGGLGSALLFSSALTASAMGKSPPPQAASPAPSPQSAVPARAPAQASAQPAQAPTAAKPAPVAIPLADIPIEADRLAGTLRDLEAHARPSPAALAIEAKFPPLAQLVADEKLDTRNQLMGTSSLTEVGNLGDLWAGIRSDLRGWADQLRGEATELGKILDQLAALNETWTATRDAARGAKAPPAVLKRTDEAVSAIAATIAQVTSRRVAVLNLQVKIGEQMVTVDEVAAQVAEVTAADISSILQRDRPPLWRAWGEGPPTGEIWPRLRASAAPQLDVLGRFAAERPRGMLAHAVLLVLLAALMLEARRRIRGWPAAERTDAALQVFEFPLSTALVVALFLSTWVYERPPTIVISVVGLILLVPLLRIAAQLTAPAPVAMVWVVAVLYLVNRLRDIALLNTPVIEQYVMVLMTGGAAVSFMWLRQRRALVIGRYWIPDPIAWLGIVLLAVSCLGGALGYMRLARFLGGGVLRSIYTAIGLYAGALVLLAYFAYLLRVWPLVRLHMVERHHLVLVRRARAMLVWAVTLLWLGTTLRWFSLLDGAENLGLAVLDYHVTRGFVSISLGDVLAFVATIWVAFLLSRFVRFALEEDVYPRLPLGRGLPYAVSSLLHYVILLLGFLAAIGAMGVDLNRVTLLTGAFGVGVGFGLQTIVNNFVSGIILLLERPIQVGDAIQMTDLDGEVRRIGIRSTTVHTWRGAEVIVPNATLISGNLTNWTLSDRTRRFELTVGVAYGADPQRVIDLLREAAAAVPGVLKNPGPVVLFQSFGDSALNFEVRAWTARFEEWAAVHSQVAVAVNGALKAAGIEIPFPQRDVTLRFPSREET